MLVVVTRLGQVAEQLVAYLLRWVFCSPSGTCEAAKQLGGTEFDAEFPYDDNNSMF